MATTNRQKTFDKDLVSLQAYLPDDKEIKSIIRMCDLQPDGWREWHCPFGYRLKALTTKLSVAEEKTKVPHSDLYQHAHPSALLFSTEVLAYSDHLLLYGDDGKVRVFEPSDIAEWRRVSPLAASLDVLRRLVRFNQANLTHDAEATYLPLACRLPPSNEALSYLNDKNEEICKSRLQTLIEVF